MLSVPGYCYVLSTVFERVVVSVVDGALGSLVGGPFGVVSTVVQVGEGAGALVMLGDVGADC
jgi:hypothetical protein